MPSVRILTAGTASGSETHDGRFVRGITGFSIDCLSESARIQQLSISSQKWTSGNGRGNTGCRSFIVNCLLRQREVRVGLAVAESPAFIMITSPTSPKAVPYGGNQSTGGV
jgi:hypothetical protein